MTNRRDFLRGTAATAFSLAAPADLFAQAAMAAPASSTWDSGAVRHLLPTVSDRRLLTKTSFNTPLSVAPTLRVDGTSVRGRMGDTRGEHWHFHATDLKQGRPRQLSLVGDKGARCGSHGSSRHPRSRRAAEAVPRAVLFLCRRPRGDEIFAAGGTDAAIRRALSFQPQAAVANGDRYIGICFHR